MFADGMDVEADLIGEHDLLEEIVHALLLADQVPGDRVGKAVAERGDAEFQP